MKPSSCPQSHSNGRTGMEEEENSFLLGDVQIRPQVFISLRMRKSEKQNAVPLPLLPTKSIDLATDEQHHSFLGFPSLLFAKMLLLLPWHCSSAVGFGHPMWAPRDTHGWGFWSRVIPSVPRWVGGDRGLVLTPGAGRGCRAAEGAEGRGRLGPWAAWLGREWCEGQRATGAAEQPHSLCFSPHIETGALRAA